VHVKTLLVAGMERTVTALLAVSLTWKMMVHARTSALIVRRKVMTVGTSVLQDVSTL